MAELSVSTSCFNDSISSRNWVLSLRSCWMYSAPFCNMAALLICNDTKKDEHFTGQADRPTDRPKPINKNDSGWRWRWLTLPSSWDSAPNVVSAYARYRNHFLYCTAAFVRRWCDKLYGAPASENKIVFKLGKPTPSRRVASRRIVGQHFLILVRLRTAIYRFYPRFEYSNFLLRTYFVGCYRGGLGGRRRRRSTNGTSRGQWR